MSNNWLEIAKRHYGLDYRVTGSGRWAIATRFDGVVRLFETREEAQNQILDPRYLKVFDLQLVKDAALAIEKMRDRHPDHERREQQ